MSGSMVNAVEISLPAELVERLELKLAHRRALVGSADGSSPVTMDDIVAEAIGTEAQWQTALLSIPRRETPGSTRVLCDCCPLRLCRRPLFWRGKHRCACPTSERR